MKQNEKIIFLDIDGVLNSIKFLENKAFSNSIEAELNSDKLILLKELIDKTNAEIVLISSWIYMPKVLETYYNRFLEFGITLFNTINKKIENRGEAVQTYIDFYHVKRYVILDDVDFDYGKYCNEEYMMIDPYYGLTKEDIQKAIAILNKDS